MSPHGLVITHVQCSHPENLFDSKDRTTIGHTPRSPHDTLCWMNQGHGGKHNVLEFQLELTPPAQHSSEDEDEEDAVVILAVHLFQLADQGAQCLDTVDATSNRENKSNYANNFVVGKRGQLAVSTEFGRSLRMTFDPVSGTYKARVGLRVEISSTKCNGDDFQLRFTTDIARMATRTIESYECASLPIFVQTKLRQDKHSGSPEKLRLVLDSLMSCKSIKPEQLEEVRNLTNDIVKQAQQLLQVDDADDVERHCEGQSGDDKPVVLSRRRTRASLASSAQSSKQRRATMRTTKKIKLRVSATKSNKRPRSAMTSNSRKTHVNKRVRWEDLENQATTALCRSHSLQLDPVAAFNSDFEAFAAYQVGEKSPTFELDELSWLSALPQSTKDKVFDDLEKAGDDLLSSDEESTVDSGSELPWNTYSSQDIDDGDMVSDLGWALQLERTSLDELVQLDVTAY